MNSEEKRQLLRRVRGFVLDMDGTIYLGNELFPFTKAFLEAAGRTGRETFFFTNNSSKNAACYIEKLRGMGIETDAGRMFTSNQVAVRHLAARFPGGRAFILGTPYLQEDFRAAGFTVESDAPDVVVLGFDTTLQYDRLRRACDFIRRLYARLRIHRPPDRGVHRRLPRILRQALPAHPGLPDGENRLRPGGAGRGGG